MIDITTSDGKKLLQEMICRMASLFGANAFAFMFLHTEKEEVQTTFQAGGQPEHKREILRQLIRVTTQMALDEMGKIQQEAEEMAKELDEERAGQPVN